jgi:hypothetical protein
MKKALRIVALFLLAIALGLPLGTYLVRHIFIDKERALGMVYEEGFLDEFAKKEFIYGDLESARKALQYAIKIHTEMQTKSSLSGWREKADLAWCYADLSRIEQSAGDTDAAKDNMTQAQQILKQLGMKDTSEVHLRQLLPKKLASNQPSGVEPR